MVATAAIELDGVRVAYAARPILDGVTLAIDRGGWLGLVGPNGGGKTTLLRAMGAYLGVERGRVALLGRSVYEYAPLERARLLTAVGADPPRDFGFTVAEYVALGRIPHGGGWGEVAEHEAVWRALALTRTEGLARRPLAELSAGELQRVCLARALAQQPRVLLLDEPTAHLDLRHQVEVMELLDDLRRREGLTIASALHDVNLAGLFCDRLAVVAGGQIVALGTPREVLTEPVLREVFGSAVRVVSLADGPAAIVPVRRRADGAPDEGQQSAPPDGRIGAEGPRSACGVGRPEEEGEPWSTRPTQP